MFKFYDIKTPLDPKALSEAIAARDELQKQNKLLTEKNISILCGIIDDHKTELEDCKTKLDGLKEELIQLKDLGSNKEVERCEAQINYYCVQMEILKMKIEKYEQRLQKFEQENTPESELPSPMLK
ncbi:hypothetical protein Lqui_1107 [Legionella quinlivanii]|uniref:Uncharacterized protein n=1 Tax=Legionella quinlivanii TaxID=45073 RepID=A0A0W0Y5K4_9GAMM|nr:hypothetical protein [Legionella quinlivanii]KTD52263.1 hypothetical protein Lqui_1107 [Legionella quinlivanii]SEF74151.1 hypothetical protein SAMN02746093_00945 [Legionella quinlivanii DSM 21216]STY12238.1 Uncharacterised protein [Legionella quinlivanii]